MSRQSEHWVGWVLLSSLGRERGQSGGPKDRKRAAIQPGGCLWFVVIAGAVIVFVEPNSERRQMV